MSEFIESLNVIDDPARLFEATLHRSGGISLNLQDGKDAVDIHYSLDEIRRIAAALGHLLYIADNHDED